MATVWGAWSSNNRLRCGLAMSMSPSTVSHSTSSVTINWTMYGQTRYASFESGGTATPYVLSGDISDSGDAGGWSAGDMGTFVIASGSHVFSTSYTSTNTINLSAHFTSSFAYPGTVTPTVSDALTIPKRPIVAPATPSGCNWSRTSDTHQTVTWTNTSPTDAAAPYTNTHVQRSTDGGSWVTIANLGVVSSYTDLGTSANHKYQYRVYASNSAGNSGYSTSSVFYTTPTPPQTCSATKTGSSIIVSWSDNSPWNDNFQLWHAANGVWDGAALSTTLTGTTYTDPAPNPAQTHQYKLTAHVPTPSLTSGFGTASNVVQLEAPPNAPSNLAPNGGVADAADDLGLSWQHNPVDTTAQSKYQVQYQIDGGAFTTMTAVSSSSSTDTITAGTWGTNGHTIGWQVRTWGAATTGGSDGTGASPWSATATVTLSSTPTVAINTPDGVTAVGLSTLTVTWGYAQAEGSPQSQWLINLYDATGTLLLETKTGTGTDTSATMATQLADATTYQVAMYVTSAAGLDSLTDSVTFSVSYAVPPTPTIVAAWQASSGTVGLTVDCPDPVSPQIAADHLQVWRSLDAGVTWALVADNVELGSTVNDHIPALRATNTYMCVAVTSLPSQATSETLDVDTTPGCHHVWVNAGPSFASAVCFTTDIDISDDDGIEKALNQFAGRTKPVETMGEQTEQVITLRATKFDPLVASSLAAETSSEADIYALSKLAAPACFRTPDGMRVFVSTGVPSIGGMGTGKVRSIQWTFVEVDYSEPVGIASS